MYTYKTATESITIDIDPHWQEVLADLDKTESNQERRHTRPDHKYAQGAPLAMDGLDNAADWLVGSAGDDFAVVDMMTDLESAMATLTELQRRYFVMYRMEGYSLAEIARLDGKHKNAIHKAVIAAENKISTFFAD